MFFMDTGLTVLLIFVVFIISLIAQIKVKSSYKKYKSIGNNSGLTGEQVAKAILRRNGITNVEVNPVAGVLTDHFDPRTNTVNLSQEVFYGRSIAAMSVAAHETGHALQYATDYLPLKMRAGMIPLFGFGMNAAMPLFFIGFLFRTPFLMDIGIFFFAAAFLFHLVTLPVEFNASSRALLQLENGIVSSNQEVKDARSMLSAAALTYVAAMLVSLAHLIRLVVLRNSRD